MSIPTHLQDIRKQMPATTAQIYLNTGTFGPLPDCVPQAMQELIQHAWQDGRIGPRTFEGMGTLYADARHRVARLLNADEQEIALTDNTGEGMNIVSYGLNWQAGDEVITTNHEHISALAPLYQIRDRFGVHVRLADLGPTAQRPLVEVLQELVTPRTRLIVLSHVTWTTGTVLDVQAATHFGHERNIPVLIDGAQSAGNIPIDVKSLGADFYAIPMQKWLCGPDGTGALYVSQHAQHFIQPTYVGYFSIKHEEGVEWELLPNAGRFELGGRQNAAIAGQSAVLAWLEDFVGHDWLFQRISALQSYAYHRLKEISTLTLHTPQPGASGLLSFSVAGYKDADIVTRLREQHNIYIRNIPSMGALRVSTGFYNTEEEIDSLTQALADL